MAKLSIIREFLAFLKHEKKWWLIPIVLMLLVLGLLVVFGEKSVLAPLLYPLF